MKKMSKISYVADEFCVSSISIEDRRDEWDICLLCQKCKKGKFFYIKGIVNLMVDKDDKLMLDIYPEITFSVCEECFKKGIKGMEERK